MAKSSDKSVSIEELDAEIRALLEKKANVLKAQLQPMKDEYAQLTTKLEALEVKIKAADPSWNPNGRRPDLAISDAMKDHLKDLPASIEKIQSWVKDIPVDKVTTLLTKGSGGERPRFVKDANGNFDLKRR